MSATLAAPNQRLDRAALGLLAIGHLSADFCQGTVPAMLPFLVQERHLSYAAAAGLVLGQTVSSSVVQPIFGRLSDRWPMPWLLPAGLLVAGVGIGLSTQLHVYAAVWLAIAASGLGIAAFHPEGARYARRASGARRVSGMSVFSVGGNAGFALGPLVTTPLLLLLGLEGGWVLGLLPVAVAGALLAGRRRVT
ncbi:MAG: MFS transporter, partial [Candidatus Dormiibacterota bacterium]